MSGTVPPFSVISGAQVARALEGREKELVDLVERTYATHADGDSVNPPSYFLRFPDRPASRIIALPASVGGDTRVDGIKWISSFPGNVADGIPRASAVLILNDHDTGYPFACLESSIISAVRTAASAAAGADHLTRSRDRPRRVGFVGTGLIARYVHAFLAGTGWEFDEIGVHDLSAASADGFSGYLSRAAPDAAVTVHPTAEALVRSSDLVVFATVAATPHVHDVSWFDHHPVVLHISLRDLAPEIVLASSNVVDDVEHCLKADTSPHLAEQRTGNRDFLDGTLADVMAGRLSVPADRTVVFSPFGLGVLDLAVGAFVHRQVGDAGELHTIDGFFHELSRHGVMTVIAAPEQFNTDDLFVDLRGVVGQPVYLKCEGFNFAGSIKLKAAVEMVDAAERAGVLRQDSVLVESSSGNLGIALSLIAAGRGYRFVCVTDPRCNEPALRLMESLGTDVHVITEPDASGGFLGARIDHVRALVAADDRHVWLNQYANPENWGAHARRTAPEIARAFPELDVLFVGAGTTGTLMGCARFFRSWHRPVHVVAVDSVGSVTFGGPPTPRMIPGLGTSVRPPMLDESMVDEVVHVSEPDTIRTCHALARRGFLFGGSTGTVVSGAADWLARRTSGGEPTVVAIAPDMGERYLDTVYRPAWLREHFGDAHDLDDDAPTDVDPRLVEAVVAAGAIPETR